MNTVLQTLNDVMRLVEGSFHEGMRSGIPRYQSSGYRVSAIPVLLTGILIGCFHKPPLLPCLDRIVQPYTLRTNEDNDSELFE